MTDIFPLVWPVVIAVLLLWIRHLDRRVVRLEAANAAATQGFKATLAVMEQMGVWVQAVSDRLDNEPCHREVK